MSIEQFNEGQTVNWEHLPETNTLLQYLCRKDLIKLSKCCKRYRNQLERRVFENLGLGRWCRKNWTICHDLEKSRNYKKILKYMKIDLGSKLRFARKFTLNREINYYFAKKFVKLLPNIRNLRLIEDVDEYYEYDDDDDENENNDDDNDKNEDSKYDDNDEDENDENDDDDDDENEGDKDNDEGDDEDDDKNEDQSDDDNDDDENEDDEQNENDDEYEYEDDDKNEDQSDDDNDDDENEDDEQNENDDEYEYEDDDEYEDEDEYKNWHFSERSLITILKGMKHLEHVELEEFSMNINQYRTKVQIFPKSLKSLKIYRKWGINCYNDKLMIYDTIDSRYENLRFLSIGSNIMLQNLHYGMPSLQAVDIKASGLDKTKLVEFLKSNPQLKKLNICSCYNEEIFNTVISFKYLERLRICTEGWRETGIEINTFSSNNSIKSLIIARCTPGSLISQLANACKNLEALELENYRYLNDLDWSKFERRDNILKLSGCSLSLDIVKNIDNSRLFNQVRFKLDKYSIGFFDTCNIDELKNYKFTHSISSTFNFKLIN